MTQLKKTFTFTPDTESTTPLWVQLRKRIVYLIGSGYFQPGDQLPKIRELAADIAINFNTVNKAYLSLQSDGYLESIRGKGVFVSEAVKVGDAAEVGQITSILDDCLSACRELGLSYDEALSYMTRRVKQLKMAESEPALESATGVIVIAPRGGGSQKEA